MDFFINECSLHGQYYDAKAFEQGIRILSTLIRRLQDGLQLIPRSETAALYLDKERIKYFGAIRDRIFVSSLNSLPDKSLRLAFIDLLFNRLNAKDWREERYHTEDDVFICGNDIVTDTSIAEITERVLVIADFVGLLFNFHTSKYADLIRIEVGKNDLPLISINCVDNGDALQNWMEATFHVSAHQYDFNLQSPPTDEQTILRDMQRFKLSTLPLQSGRKVYRELQANRYWYVDNLHFGRAAHLEVFDLQGKHIGEADIEGNVDEAKRDLHKRITT